MINLLKQIYMNFIKIYSKRISKKRTLEKVVYLMSFPDNNDLLIEQLAKKYSVVVYYTDSRNINHSLLNELGIESYSIKSFSGLMRAVQDVTRSKVTICDNYFPFLGAIKTEDTRFIVQVWHATGAIKCFGLEDRQLVNRSKEDLQRFLDVYDAFDYYVVASKAMADVFKRSYGAHEEQMLYLGFPRTDALFKEIATKKDTSKKTILYLPTYREGQTELPPLDIERMRIALKNEYQLIVKLHPHVSKLVVNQKDDEFISWHSDKTTEKLIKEADVLITDYSSVAYDYALIHPNGKLIFYWYDQEEYNQTTGIQKDIEITLPNKICKTQDELIFSILDNSKNELEGFNQIWNTYNDGKSVDRVVEVVGKWMCSIDGTK